MKKFSINFFTFLLGAVLFLGSYPVLYAQESEESDTEEFTLEEITVTAEKREENLQKVPRSLSIITSDDLNLRTTNTVMDILENTAGVQFFGFFNHFAMRGLAPNTNEAGSEPGVQFNVDGNLALNIEGRTTAPINMAMMDVERVEVLRGPSGAINGRMASAGTINVITKDPEFQKFDGYVGYTLGNYNTKNAKAAINIPLALTGLDLPSYLENLAVRISAAQNSHDEYIHNAKGEGVSGSQENLNARIKLKYSPIEDITINTQMSYSRDASNMGMSVPPIDHVKTWPGTSEPHPDDPWMNANGSKAGLRDGNTQYMLSADINWSTRFANISANWGASWVPVTCQPGDPNCAEGKIGQGTYEVRASSPAESKISWMLGANIYNKQEYVREESLDKIVEEDINIYYANDQTGLYGKPSYFSELNTDPDLVDYYNPNRIEFGQTFLDSNGYSLSNNPLGFTGDVTEDSVVFVSQQRNRPIDAYAGYASVSVPFLEKHTFTISMRKDFEKKKRYHVLGIFGAVDEDGNRTLPHFSFEYNQNPDGTYSSTDGAWICDNCEMIYEEEPYVMETEDNPIDYTFGYQYQWKDDVLIYTNVNTGFRPGGISPNAVPAQFYRPEKTINYALGARSQWLSNRLRINAEFYLMSVKNHQLNMAQEGELSWTAPNGVTYTSPYKFSSLTMNMGKMNNYGLELDYEWLITGKDRVKGNIEYKHSYYGELAFYRGPSANPPGSTSYADFGGRPMAFAPKYTAYASYSHGFFFSNLVVTPQFDVRWSDKYFLFQEYWWEATNPEMEQPSYFKYDAYVNMAPTDGKWQINAYGKNLTETVIRNASFMDVNIQDPRTYGLSLTVNF